MEIMILRWRETQNQMMITVIIGVIMAMSFGVLIVRMNPRTNLVLLLAISVVLLAPLIMRIISRNLDPFEPIVVFAAAYGIVFVVRPLFIVLTDEYIIDRWFQRIDLRSSYTAMIVIALVGAVSFMVGYESRLGRTLARWLPAPPDDFLDHRVVAGSLGVSLAGLFLWGTFILMTGASVATTFRDPTQLGLFSKSTGYFELGSLLLLPSALGLTCFGIWRRRPSIRTIGLLILITFLFLSLSGGDRLQLLPLGTGFLVFFYARRDRRPSVSVLIVILLVGLIASSFVLLARTPSLRQDASLEAVFVQTVSDPPSWIEPLTEGDDNQMSDTFAIVMQVVPDELPYKYGAATIGELVTRPIPRLIWNTKPLIPNKQLTQHLWPQAYGYGIANPEYSILTHFYWDFGIPGVVAGMTCYGAISRALYEYFLLYRRNIVAVLFLGVGLSFVAFGLRSNPVDNLLKWMIMGAPLWLIFQFGQRLAVRNAGSQPDSFRHERRES